ncbi:TPA: hypothetical protein I0G98_RS08040, partial [Enterococcus faecalis]|nr:hypothetical protein [Enterococcus faecalis]
MKKNFQNRKKFKKIIILVLCSLLFSSIVTNSTLVFAIYTDDTSGNVESQKVSETEETINSQKNELEQSVPVDQEDSQNNMTNDDEKSEMEYESESNTLETDEPSASNFNLSRNSDYIGDAPMWAQDAAYALLRYVAGDLMDQLSRKITSGEKKLGWKKGSSVSFDYPSNYYSKGGLTSADQDTELRGRIYQNLDSSRISLNDSIEVKVDNYSKKITFTRTKEANYYKNFLTVSPYGAVATIENRGDGVQGIAYYRTLAWQYVEKGGVVKDTDRNFNIDLKNLIEVPPLTAESISKDILLGQDIALLNPKESIKKVTFGTKELKPGEYSVKWDSNLNINDIVGTRTWIATITFFDGGGGPKYVANVQIPFNVKWGSTVRLKGYGDYSIGAITLHQKGGDNLELTDSVGIVRDPYEIQVHKGFIGESYYDVRLLGVSDTVQKLTSLDPVTEYNSLAWAHGEANAEAAINKFGDNSNGRQKARVGNILEVTHAEPNRRERLIVNEKETQENNGQNLVYYELTKNGFSPLRVNQLKAKESTIPLDSNNEYLNQHIKDYIDLKGYSTIEVKKFSSFPETDKVGKTSGKIVVEETLKSGKKVQWEYEVPFIVKAELSAEAVSTSVNLGTDSISIDSMVKNVKLGNRELSKGEYEVALKNKVDTSTVGIKPTIVVVSAEGEKVEVTVSVTVKWGSTVLLKGYGDDSIG